jgi:hypothetical protein
VWINHLSDGICREDSQDPSSTELSIWKIDLEGVQEVRWEGSGTVPAGEYTFLNGKGNENHEFGTGVLYVTQS